MRVLGFCLCLLTCVGCNTVPKGLTVELGNSSGEPLRDVSLSSDQQAVYSLGAIDESDSTIFDPPLDAIPQAITLSWLDKSGKRHSAQFAAAEKLKADYKGSIHFQINPGNTLKVFQREYKGPGAGNQPWARVEDWEGTTSIPGLGGQ